MSRASLGVTLLCTSACPEPGEAEAGGETGGETSGQGGVETSGDLERPLDTGADTTEAETGGTGMETETGGETETGEDDEEGFDAPGRCWDAAWRGEELPALIFDNTIDRNDDVLTSCGIADAPDYQLDFRAPWSGTFVFDTAGSSFDTVLMIEDGPCGSTELACNDDFVDLQSRLVVTLEAGQEVTVHVDGTNPFEQGPFQLHISEFEAPECEAQPVNPPYPKLLVGDTSLGTNVLEANCGGFDAPEQVFEFLAQGPGSYRFSTAGSSFDTVLYTLDSEQGCGGQPLQCNDDANFELQSELTVELAGGERVLVVVDGNDDNDFGAFELLAEKLD